MLTLEGDPSRMRARIPSCLESFLDLIAEYTNSLQWSSPHLIYVGLPSSVLIDTLSDYKSSKNLQYTTTSSTYTVNIPQSSAHTTSYFLA